VTTTQTNPHTEPRHTCVECEELRIDDPRGRQHTIAALEARVRVLEAAGTAMALSDHDVLTSCYRGFDVWQEPSDEYVAARAAWRALVDTP
jgi:hypothetical protein